MEMQGVWNSQNNLEKENKSGGLTQISILTIKLLSVRLYWHKEGHTEQWNSTESPE